MSKTVNRLFGLKNLKPISLAILSIGVTACGGTGQDEGRVSALSSDISGSALDGPIAGGRVFIDLNGNREWDSFENAARTDSEGNFSRSAGGVDYCADEATDQQQQYCLQSNAALTNVSLCVRGGYDIVTLTPFNGTICRTVSVEANGDLSTIVSPLTTLVDSVDASVRSRVLDALGLTEAQLNVDYINQLGVDADAVRIFKKAQLLVKVAGVIQNRIEDRYDGINEEDELPDDILETVIVSLGEVIAARNSGTDTIPFEQILVNSDDLSSTISKAEDAVVQIYNNAEQTLPARISNSEDGSSTVSDTTVLNQVITVAANLATIADNAIDENGISTAGDVAAIVRAATGAANAVEVYVQKANGDGVLTDEAAIQTEIANAAADSAFLDAISNTLSADNVDISVLVENDLTTTDESSDVLNQVQLDETAQRFVSLGGKSLRVNDPENLDPVNQKHARIELFFEDGTETTSGDLSACIRYIDGSGFDDPNGTNTPDDSDLADGDTRGTWATGTWEILDDNGYTALVALRVTRASEPYEAIVKSAGPNEQSQQRFRFDFDGGLETWLSVDGIAALATDFTVPATNEACRTHFTNNPDEL